MEIITRSQWGARPPKSVSRLAADPPGFVLHWEGTKVGTLDHAKCADMVRGIQQFHMTSDQIAKGGGADIAYNFLACQHGYVFEGRGWGVRSGANGTNDANAHNYAVCCLAGPSDPFPEDQKRAVKELTTGYVVRPHSFFFGTDCPGTDRRKWLTNGLPIQDEVSPMFNPALILRPIVAELNCPTGGAWLLGDDGSVYAFGGAPYLGGANGQGYFFNRKPATLELPNAAEAAAGKRYTIVATSGERYSY